MANIPPKLAPVDTRHAMQESFEANVENPHVPAAGPLAAMPASGTVNDSPSTPPTPDARNTVFSASEPFAVTQPPMTPPSPTPPSPMPRWASGAAATGSPQTGSPPSRGWFNTLDALPEMEVWSPEPAPVHRSGWPDQLVHSYDTHIQKIETILPVLAEWDTTIHASLQLLVQPLLAHCSHVAPDLLAFLQDKDSQSGTSIYVLAALLAEWTSQPQDVRDAVTALLACGDADRSRIATMVGELVARQKQGQLSHLICGSTNMAQLIDALSQIPDHAVSADVAELTLRVAAKCTGNLEDVVSALLFCETRELRHRVTEATVACTESIEFTNDTHSIMRALAHCDDATCSDVVALIHPFAALSPSASYLPDIIFGLIDCPTSVRADIVESFKPCCAHFPGGKYIGDVLSALSRCENKAERDALVGTMLKLFDAQFDHTTVKRAMDVLIQCHPETRLSAIAQVDGFISDTWDDHALLYIMRAFRSCADERAQTCIAAFAHQCQQEFGPDIHPKLPTIMLVLASSHDPHVRASTSDMLLRYMRTFQDSCDNSLENIALALRDCKDESHRQSVMDVAVAYLEKNPDGQRDSTQLFLALAHYRLSPADAATFVQRTAHNQSIEQAATCVRQLHLQRAMATAGIRDADVKMCTRVMGRVFAKEPLSPEDRKAIRDLITTDPRTANIISSYLVPTTMEFWDGGTNFNTYSSFFASLIPDVQAPADDAVRACMAATPVTSGPPVAVALPPGKLVDVCGRTLLFEIPGDPDHYVAVKIAKQGENVDDATSGLRREEWMNRVLTTMRGPLGLESEIPRAIAPGVASVVLDADMRARIEAQATRLGGLEFEAAVDDTTGHAVAIQSIVPKGYHRYLNDPDMSPEAFRQASDQCLRDYARLCKAGIYHSAPADFFHNKEHERRYVWNSEEVPASAANRATEGPGRLHNAFGSVLHPNLRETGPADFKHMIPQSELLTAHPNAGFFASVEAHASEIATITSVGDLLLSWSLIVVDRWAQRASQGKSGTEAELAEEMRHGFIVFYAQYKEMSPESAAQLLDSFIDFPRMAQQFAYFTSGQFVSDAQKPGGISQERWHDLYGDRTSVLWLMEEGMRGWSRAGGWRYDSKHIDLGPVNGPFPCPELMKALYFTTHWAMMPSD